MSGTPLELKSEVPSPQQKFFRTHLYPVISAEGINGYSFYIKDGLISIYYLRALGKILKIDRALLITQIKLDYID